MINTDKYEGHTPAPWCVDDNEESDYNENPNGTHIYALRLREDVAPHPVSAGLPIAQHTGHGADARLIADAPLLLAEVKRLREENDLLRSMQTDGIEVSAHNKLLSEIKRLSEDNEKLHDAINRSFHARISGSALEIYNGWWEGEEE